MTRATFIVVLRCNLDDVICGANTWEWKAFELAKRVLADPKAWAETNNMQTWDASGVIGVSVFKVRGEKVELIETMLVEEAAAIESK